ncbi:MAG: NTP transferase domain-containing protein [Candidatus Omnitrophota bacterium]|jgi:bifunctional UDP-N-acetylglucosamine pyrophosphorylase/glucosamine-1-phosphate N-acetyltransferase
MDKKLAIIILAAGKGVRMKSSIPKVMHKVCGRPMLGYVVDLAFSLNPKRIVAVLGHKHQLVREEVPAGVKVALQKRLAGTADAVKVSLKELKGFNGAVVILYGDVPLLKKETVKGLIKRHLENNADVTCLTADLKKPKGYGRVLRDKYSSVCGIVEEKEADDFDKDIKEINTGIMCFNKKSLEAALGKVRADNKKKEYYLTDVIKILYSRGGLIEGVKIEDVNEAMGINSRVELAKANLLMQSKINEDFMLKGVSIIDPGSTFINYGARIGRDSVIYPFTVIESDVKIGKRCSVGPFARLRDGARILDDVTLGNFLEITRAKIGKNTFAKHFCYIADSRVGNSVNIGAGTVTANFDGLNKHNTVIKDKVFIGSDTVMVAPVKVGKGSKTGAGAVVIRDIPEGKTAVGVPARILKKKG